MMTSIGSTASRASTGATSLQGGTTNSRPTPSTGSSATQATEADQTGYSARTARYGPLVGAVLGTADLVSSTVDATYDVAATKLQQVESRLESAAKQTTHALETLGSAATKAWSETETALTHGADNVSTAAHSLASALGSGVQKLGQWIDDAA